MASSKATSIEQYIQSAPPQAQSHLRTLYSILKSVAPKADQTIKWGTPFFVEPRFLFSFSAHKAHCNLAATPEALEPFAKELEKFSTTRNFLQISYDEPVPEELVRKIAEYRLKMLSESEDDSFW